MPIVVAFSGEICSGKSSVCEELKGAHAFAPIRTGEYLREKAIERALPTDRQSLQQLGDDLDNDTSGGWLLDAFERTQIHAGDSQRFLLDSVRKKLQLEQFRSRPKTQVLHVHIFAPEHILKRRFEERKIAGQEYSGKTTYEAVKLSQTEQNVHLLKYIADIVFDSSDLAASEIATQIVREITI